MARAQGLLLLRPAWQVLNIRHLDGLSLLYMLLLLRRLMGFNHQLHLDHRFVILFAGCQPGVAPQTDWILVLAAPPHRSVQV